MSAEISEFDPNDVNPYALKGSIVLEFKKAN